MLDIVAYRHSELSESEATAMLSLLNNVWPSKEKSLPELVEEWLTGRSEVASRDNLQHIVIWEEGRVIAYANTFARQIHTSAGVLTVMGLSGVCVASSCRGKGLGKAIVRRAFEQVDRGLFPVSLYQTGVRLFYEKLGARIVHNTFVNSKNIEDPQANPWWDLCVMIYPARYDWPEEAIDLNGRGY